jgi:PEP-CTERM motif
MNLNREVVPAGNWVAWLWTAVMVSAVLLLSGNAMAQNVTLTDGGSTATLNLGAAGGGTGTIGMNSWSVLNQNQLNQQWFWYSIVPPQNQPATVAQSIDTLGLANPPTLTGNNQLSVTYGTPTGLNIGVDYTLTGPSPGNADITENIYADNYSSSAITINLYEYSNFNLLQSGNNTATIFQANPGPGYQAVMQVNGGTAIQEGIVSPYANYAETEPLYQTLNNITGTPGYNLNGNLTASGNVSWAFQWTVTLNPGDELAIVKDKSLSVNNVPEPSTLALIALGMGALGLSLRRKLS